jgi:thiopurine S-methyltransferase
VPLCGKSVDLEHLAAGGTREVIGIELAEAAAKAFFDERKLTPAVTTAGPFTRYSAAGMTILVGDFFEATAAHVGRIDAVFDRAALVALNASLRPRYAKSLLALAGAAPLLLISFEHELVHDEPPFSVPEAEVRQLFSGRDITLLERTDALESSATLRARGAKAVFETAFLLTAPSTTRV